MGGLLSFYLSIQLMNSLLQPARQKRYKNDPKKRTRTAVRYENSIKYGNDWIFFINITIIHMIHTQMCDRRMKKINLKRILTIEKI